MAVDRESGVNYSEEISRLKEKGIADSLRGMKTRKIVQVGVLATFGAGIGVLAGLAGSIAAATVLEAVIPSLLITKTAGIVGGAAGMLKGVNGLNKEGEQIDLTK
ncbi:MAG: hypothetical protein HN353_05620 [Bdellovibrionales bacterium]|jgi:hypothetical protein|nr:hypothetical protein [Bdellovibrionales bacterium]MBT3525079.1 hypothetical protein [Bdellovibrionales bacterium]MBT7669781.1 hypothetical protein [Bdellovibrionales bacterium]MBT7767400.1 hypothetical protein [Bdellovibrionales bacterium]